MPDIKVIKANAIPGKKSQGKNRRLRVAAYCRVSTDGEEQISSYNSQLSYYREYISKNPDWVMAGIYADKAITGTKADKRPDFMRMINDCLNDEIDMVVTKSISRFARNTVDTLHYVRMLKERGIAIFFEEEHINTLSMDGELMLMVLSSVAQQEVHNTSEHVKKGLKMKMERGELVGFQGCLGYDYHTEDKSVTINEEEAETIRYIYRRYLEGMGCMVIARECTQLGFKTKAGNTTWHDSGIRGILRNEKYCGDILMGKTFTVDPITKRRLRNFGEEDKYYLENHHTAIISKEDFMAAQTILDNRGTPRRIVDGKRQEKLSRQYAFSCMVKCGYCGATFTRRNWHKGKGYDKVVWQCVNNTKGGKKCCERSKAIPEEVLEGAFIDAYNYLSKNKKVCFDKLYKSIKSNLKDEDLASLIGKNERKLSSLELKKKNLVDLKLSDGIDEKTYKDAFDDVVGRINAVNADLEMLKADKEVFDSKVEKIKLIEAVIKEGNEITTFDRYLFEVTVERVVVGEENDPYKIKFFLKTKQVYEVNAMEYILKKKRGTLINGFSYQHKADDVGHQPLGKSPDTCGDCGVA